MSRLWTGWRTALVIVKPATVIAWHRRGLRLFWTWKSRRRTGRRTLPLAVRRLIRTMSEANPLWGAPRIHGELLKLGIEVGQASVAKQHDSATSAAIADMAAVLEESHQPIVAADFFVVPTATYRLLFVLILLPHDRRRVVHVAVTAHSTAAWTAQQLRVAFPWDQAPRFLLHDRDHAFGNVTATALGMCDVLTALRSPWQNPYAERLIGSIRRDCLNHVVVLGEPHLRRVLAGYLAYDHGSRTHLSLTKDAPTPRRVQGVTEGDVIAIREVGGLHHRYERRAGRRLRRARPSC